MTTSLEQVIVITDSLWLYLYISGSDTQTNVPFIELGKYGKPPNTKQWVPFFYELQMQGHSSTVTFPRYLY